MGANNVDTELIQSLRQAIATLSNKQFDQLIFFLINEIENEDTVSFIPDTQEGNLNLKVDHTLPLLTIQYGIAVIQHSDDSHVSAEVVRSVNDSVNESNHIDAGVMVTASTPTDEAESVAVNRGVELVDGDELVTLLIEHGLGINNQNGAVVLNETFWKLFRGQTRSGVIDSLEIPQADSLSRLRQTLSAIESGNHHKEDIARNIERISGESFEPRQADYYATAGWLLGFLHKERRSEKVTGRGRWGITRLGQTYLSTYESGNYATADRVLSNQIRSIEIVRRIIAELQNQGSLSRDDLIDIIARESELGGSTVGRRARSVVNWMTELSEINNGSGDQYLSYSESNELSIKQVSMDTDREPAMIDDQTTETSTQDPVKNENQILDNIISSFETID